MGKNTTLNKRLFNLVVGAMGVIYADLGTSPLYTVKECFNETTALPLTADNILGLLSLVSWALLMVISLKYAMFIVRADNNGKGGIISLITLAFKGLDGRRHWIFMVAGVFAAALFYGDGMITPAISVLSAVEGLEVAAPLLSPYILPLTVLILVSLFLLQNTRTGKISNFFGPIMFLWFICLAVLGLFQIIKEPQVLKALNPIYAYHFFVSYQKQALIALGAVFLAFTGAEALYTDMGNDKKPIRTAWFYVVFPSLLLNYYGQGSLLLYDPTAIQNPFYLLTPSWGLYPMVLLSTIAAIIASQTIISGTISMSKQAISSLPRFQILHRSAKELGKIYIPKINRWLWVMVIGLVIGFRFSDGIAVAYEVIVTGIMVITPFLTFVIARYLWRWGWGKIGPLLAVFLSIDLIFFSSHIMAIMNGGWFPFIIAAAAILTCISTWKVGREIWLDKLYKQSQVKG